MTALLAISSLTGGYGETDVVFDVSLSVGPGEILGIFGRNGVGKSTLARLVQGSLAPSSGTLTFNGRDISALCAFKRRRLGIGYMPQTAMVFDDLTVRENLDLGMNANAVEPYFALFPRLEERLDQQAGTMSGGERKILSFVRAMIEDSTAIVLDEPSEGVQPENIRLMSDCLKERAESGAAIILIEQNLKFLCQTASRFVGMDSGRQVVALDTPDLARMREVLSV